MQLIDTHAHIYGEVFQADHAQVLLRSQAAGVGKILLPNIDANTIAPMVAIETAYPDICYAMMGLHPCYVQADFEKQLYIMENWLQKRAFIGIGEIGMDLYRDTSTAAYQKAALHLQLQWAKKYQLPVVFHIRAAFKEVLTILEKHQDGCLRGIFHCFTGTLPEAQRIIALGFHLGIGGIITFPKSDLAPTVAKIPLEHLVLETDSPYLTPVPHRGKRNEPSYLPYIATTIAAHKNIPIAQVVQATTQQAQKLFFPLPKKGSTHEGKKR